jgi:putative ABC transport system permease protein
MEIDKQLWVPLTTLQAQWPSWWTEEDVVSKVVYRMRDRHLLAETKAEVRAILADRLGVPPTDSEAVGIWSSLETLNRLPLDETRFVMLALATTLLVIGGVGVLNMMWDAVHERRQEIGVRLAIGARRRSVVLQFFFETFLITVLGGLLGAALGAAGCLLLAGLDLPDLVPVPVLDPGVVGLALGVMVCVGLLASVIPAWRASRVDPAEILRME